jgi:hypothetical protein
VNIMVSPKRRTRSEEQAGGVQAESLLGCSVMSSVPSAFFVTGLYPFLEKRINGAGFSRVNRPSASV